MLWSTWCHTSQCERPPTGWHTFDQGCAGQGVEHCLILSYRPQTNGMVERFNGRIADVLNATRSVPPPTWSPPSTATPGSTT